MNRQRHRGNDSQGGHHKREAPAPLSGKRVLDHAPTYSGPPHRHVARYYA